MSKNSNTVAALIAGAAIGAGLGILFAPDKGSKTRAKLKEGLDDTKHNLLDSIEASSEVLFSKYNQAKESLDDTYEDLLSNMSYKTEEVISFLEKKLADLKESNAKLQK